MEPTSQFFVDLNGNGTWDGNGGGDDSLTITAWMGPGFGMTGDWNADGLDDPGKHAGSLWYWLDLNGNLDWDGRSAGDATTFTRWLRVGTTPVVGDWDDDGDDDVGVYESARDRFFDVRGGGFGFQFAASRGAGQPLVGVFDPSPGSGDGIGKYVFPRFYLDTNRNLEWDGNAGGDRNTSFAASFGSGSDDVVAIVGDWDGDGVDEIGLYVMSIDRFLLDLNGNGSWDGNAGGDLNTSIASSAGAGVPMVCDWDGDGADDIGKFVAPVYYVDLNGNLRWDGDVGGDRATDFAAGFGQGTPMPAVWSGP